MNVASLLSKEQLRELGSPLIGAFVACGLWGAAFSNTIWYYQRFPKDRIGFHLLVGLVASVDFLHTALLIAGSYYRYVNNFGDMLASLRLDWRTAALLPLLTIITLLVQGFFAWRLWILSNRNAILPLLIIFSSILTIACGGVYTQRNTDPETFIKNTLEKPDAYFMAAVCLPAASDALIVCSMVWVAWKNRHTFSHTQRVFLGWVELAFETNAITFILCLATAIAYGAKAPYYGAPFSFVCVKIYDLTLTITLHALVELPTESLSSKIQTGSSPFRSGQSSERSTVTRLPLPVPLISLQTTSDEKQDIGCDPRPALETV